MTKLAHEENWHTKNWLGASLLARLRFIRHWGLVSWNPFMKRRWWSNWNVPRC